MVVIWKRRDRRLRALLTESEGLAEQDFSGARLVALDLRRKALSGCNFEFADLTEANLTEADLRGANLHGAYLNGAVLAGADLSRATLDESMLLGADLRDAQLQDATFDGAIWDQETFWPAQHAPEMGPVGMWRGRRRRG